MDWSKFFSMGGYGFYVWWSYLVAFLVMGGEVVLLIKRSRRLRQLHKEQLTDQD